MKFGVTSTVVEAFLWDRKRGKINLDESNVFAQYTYDVMDNGGGDPAGMRSRLVRHRAKIPRSAAGSAYRIIC